MATKFQKGKSGNPAGRPKGSKNRATLLAIAAMEGELDAVVRKIIEAAKSGDMTAARLVVDKLIPAAKERPISFNLHAVSDAVGCAEAQAKIVAAVAEGEILPSEGDTLSGLVEHQRRAIETTDIIKRLEALEQVKKT
jgi:hypothetical protein